MSAEVEVVSNLPAVRERSSVLLMPVMDVQTAMARLEEFQAFCSHYLQESTDGGLDGGDYGPIPGAGKKKVLLKSGADKLCEIYGLYDEYLVLSSVEDWEKGLFDYTLKCVLKSRRDDSTVGSGVGSCSSFESKYRWRDQKRACPNCGKPTIIRAKNWTTGEQEGWVCWKKEGKSDGCNTKFKDGDKKIEDQVTGRIENPDIIDSKNTVLKMAKKRAKIDATIGVTRSSGIFTQDLDDLPIPVTPTKPPVPVTTETIDLGPVGNNADVKPLEKGSASGAVAPKQWAPFADDDKPCNPVAPADDKIWDEPFVDTPTPVGDIKPITQGQAVYFARKFKEALRKELQKDAENLRHHWLEINGFKDVNGIPTALAITSAAFDAVVKEAATWAKKQ